MIILLLLSRTVYRIPLDELITSCAQIRIGPSNLGYYGIFSSLVNGPNPTISQFLIPKLHIIIGFQAFPIRFMFFSFFFYLLISPFFLVDVYIGSFLVLFRSSLSTPSMIFTSFSGYSKHTILGSICAKNELKSRNIYGS